MNTYIFHTNGDHETNRWASERIGDLTTKKITTNGMLRGLSPQDVSLFQSRRPEEVKNVGSFNLSEETNMTCGAFAWGLGSLLAVFIPFIRSPLALVLEMSGNERVGDFIGNGCFTFGVGTAMVTLQLVWGGQNLAQMQRYRQDCIAYHSRSRGISRWGGNTPFVFVGMVGALFLFDFPVFVLFLIGTGLAAKLAAEQDAAVYSRYLDMLDQQVEKEYLENAILGQCPTEITQLTHPLPDSLKSQYRTNVAAAAVNKPVKIVAQPPKPKAGFTPPPMETSPDMTGKA
jgi:hypothetical protein